MGVDVAQTLTEIQVSIAALRGEVHTFTTELRGRADTNRDGIARIERTQVDHGRRLTSLESTRDVTRGRAMGMAAAAAALGSGGTAGILKLFDAFAS